MKKSNKKEKITIEKLATMINTGFNKTATKEQVEKIDNRLKVIEEEFEKIKGLPHRVKTLEEALEIE